LGSVVAPSVDRALLEPQPWRAVSNNGC